MDRHGSRLVSGSIDTRPERPRRAPHWSEIAAYGFALGAATVVLTAVMLQALGGHPITPAAAPAVIVASPSAPACAEPTSVPSEPATARQMTVRVVVDPPEAMQSVSVDDEPVTADAEVGGDVPARAARRPAPRGPDGVIRIGTEAGSRPAIVHVDGERIGMTPIVSHRVAPGKHTVEFHWPDCATLYRTVHVDADEATTVRAGSACSHR